MSKLMGTVCQVGYIVGDIEAAMQKWVAIGVGPWFYRKVGPMTSFTYYGKEATPAEFPEVSIALANSGDMQIELIQQRNDSPSLYKDTMDAGAEGVQHIAYWTDDRYDEFRAHLLEQGFVEGHTGRIGTAGRFGYFLHPVIPGTLIEISETHGKRARFDAIRAAARAWDGSDPIRDMAVLNPVPTIA